MKLLVSIMLNMWLLLVFTAAPTVDAWACGTKSLKKEIKSKKTCQKECCNTSKKTKKRCCNDDNCSGNCGQNGCSCPSPNGFIAILTPAFNIRETPQMAFIQKQPIPFTEKVPKSVFIKFWQPPKL